MGSSAAKGFHFGDMSGIMPDKNIMSEKCQIMPRRMSKYTSGRMPDRMSNYMSDRMPDRMMVGKCQKLCRPHVCLEMSWWGSLEVK